MRLDQFFGGIEGSPTAVREREGRADPGATKLHASAFVELYKAAVKTFYATGGKAARRLKGYRLAAIDGSGPNAFFCDNPAVEVNNFYRRRVHTLNPLPTACATIGRQPPASWATTRARPETTRVIRSA